jgi:hypothetical protein
LLPALVEMGKLGRGLLLLGSKGNNISNKFFKLFWSSKIVMAVNNLIEA